MADGSLFRVDNSGVRNGALDGNSLGTDIVVFPSKQPSVLQEITWLGQQKTASMGEDQGRVSKDGQLQGVKLTVSICGLLLEGGESGGLITGMSGFIEDMYSWMGQSTSNWTSC